MVAYGVVLIENKYELVVGMADIELNGAATFHIKINAGD